MAQKTTIFQRLDRAITGNWNPNYIEPLPQYHTNSYDMTSKSGSKVLYTTTDKQDYETKKLTMQQDKFLKDRWYKANESLTLTAFNGLNNVKLMYRDADLMDSSPEIGAALDTYAQEATLVNDKAQCVLVYSQSDRIKSILEDLFVNRLTITLMAPVIVRNMCKYGNCFMMLDIDSEHGVKNWKELPVWNVERIENGVVNPYGGGASIALGQNTGDSDDMSTKFIWTDDNQSQIPFRNWQVGHFRLINNSMYAPYGVSILNSARRSWRELSLMEDMMLMYRLERSSERRVYKVYVGAIDDADVQAYVEQVATNMKRAPIVDPATGQIDLRKNVLPVHKDTPIPLLDGRTISIENLAKEYEEGKTNYVYSIQDNTHQIVPGKVIWCGKNYTADELVKITLDDDTYCILAKEHEMIMRDGSKKRADQLTVGESIMPFYKKIDKNSEKLFDRYEKVYNPSSSKYEFTHRLIASTLSKGKEEYNTVHHKDFNKYNNSPENLLWCDYFEHHKMHSELSKRLWQDPEKRKIHCQHLSESRKGKKLTDKQKAGMSRSMKERYANGQLDFMREIARQNIAKFNQSPERLELNKRIRQRNLERGYTEEFRRYNESELHTQHNEIRRVAAAESWIGEGRTNRIEKMNIHFDDFIWNALLDEILAHRITKRKDMLEFINTKLINHLIEINCNKRLEHNRFISRRVLQHQIQNKGFATITEYIEASLKNHKIKNIEIISGDDVYCMTVVGLNHEEDRHNFALCTFNADKSICQNGCFVSNCNTEDLFVPVRNTSEGSPVETLPAGNNLTAIDDIKYIQNKMLAALRMPRSFYNFEDAAGDGKNLALMDVRFARNVNNVQQAFLMELTKIATIHLHVLGFDDELTNFSLAMNNPSTQGEQLEIETTQKKIDAIRDAVSDPGGGIPVMSLTKALKEIMHWSEKEIKDNFEEIRLEKGIAAELEKTSQIIKKTGIFNTVDRIYGEPGAKYQDEQGGMQDPNGGMGGGMPGGGGMGGADFGSGLDSLGAPGADENGDIRGQEGGMPMADMGAESPEGGEQAPEGGEPPVQENILFDKPLILEETDKTSDAQAPLQIVEETKPKKKSDFLIFEDYIKRLDSGAKKKPEITIERAEVYDKSVRINEEFDKIMQSIDDFLDD